MSMLSLMAGVFGLTLRLRTQFLFQTFQILIRQGNMIRRYELQIWKHKKFFFLFNGKGNFRDYVQLEKNPFHPFSTTIQLYLKFSVGIFETLEFEAITVFHFSN